MLYPDAKPYTWLSALIVRFVLNMRATSLVSENNPNLLRLPTLIATTNFTADKLFNDKIPPETTDKTSEMANNQAIEMATQSLIHELLKKDEADHKLVGGIQSGGMVDDLVPTLSAIHCNEKVGYALEIQRLELAKVESNNNLKELLARTYKARLLVVARRVDDAVADAIEEQSPSKKFTKTKSDSAVITKEELEDTERECDICAEVFPFVEVAQAICGCFYCHDCIVMHVTVSFHNHIEPECCENTGTWDRADYQFYLTVGEYQDWGDMEKKLDQQRAEYTLPNRIYCSKLSCSILLDSGAVADGKIVCGTCGTATCVACKAHGHEGECPVDGELAEVLRMAEVEQWNRCPTCQALIERTHGCSLVS